MDNLIQKFYSNGKEEEQKYTQFGAFSNSLMKNSKLTFIKPNIGLVNPTIHNVETDSQNQIPKTPNKPVISNDAYLKPKKLIFNSSSDLFNQNIPKNNFAYSANDENNNIEKHSIPSLQTMKQDINKENKKNSTKMQMMEEKMKNLELKSQRLEVINDFFFDMFENNLVKEELKRQKGIKEEKEEDYGKEEIEERSEVKEKQRKKRHKKKKKELAINPQLINDEEAFENNFKEKTDKFARKYLNTVKTDLGLLLVEKQIQKNELLNNITEEILDLKGDLMNKLEKLEMKQKSEIKTLAYCLQNSGDDKVENLANRLFGDDVLKPEEENLNFNYTDMNSMDTTGLKFTGTAFNNGSLFRTTIQQRKRKSSIETNNEEKSTNVKFKEGNGIRRRSSLIGKDNNEENRIRRRSSLIGKDNNNNNEENRIRRRSSLFAKDKVIIEEKDGENE